MLLGHSKGDQSWVSFGRNDAKAETPVLWLSHVKSDWLEKTLMLEWIGGRKRRGWQRMRCWMTSPTPWTWVWVTSGSWWCTGGLACCNSCGCKGLDTTEPLNWTELKGTAELNLGRNLPFAAMTLNVSCRPSSEEEQHPMPLGQEWPETIHQSSLSSYCC